MITWCLSGKPMISNPVAKRRARKERARRRSELIIIIYICSLILNNSPSINLNTVNDVQQPSWFRSHQINPLLFHHPSDLRVCSLYDLKRVLLLCLWGWLQTTFDEGVDQRKCDKLPAVAHWRKVGNKVFEVIFTHFLGIPVETWREIVRQENVGRYCVNPICKFFGNSQVRGRSFHPEHICEIWEE